MSTLTRSAHARDAAHKSLAIRIAFAAVVTIALLFAAAANADRAQAAYVVTGFQVTPTNFQAGGHPSVTNRVTADALNADRTGGDDLKKLVIDYPAGFAVNPEAAAPKCVASGTGLTNKFTSDTCPSTSFVGTINMAWRDSLGQLGSAQGSVNVLTPTTAGSAATLGLTIRPPGWKKIFLKAELRHIVPVRIASEAKYGMSMTADTLPRSLSPTVGFSLRAITLSDFSIVFSARAGGASTTAPNGSFFVFNPTRCDAADFRGQLTMYSGGVTTRTGSFAMTGCDQVPLAPGASVKPTVATPGASTGVDAQFTVPTADAPEQQSHIRDMRVDLPAGSKLNPTVLSSSTTVCSDTSLSSDTCPAGSKVGTASALVPFLPPAFSGDVFLQTRTGTIGLAIILRGPGGVKLVRKGTLAHVDSDGDGVADRVRIAVSSLPQVAWSTASLKLTSLLVKNPDASCLPPTASSTFTGWSGAASTVTNDWSAGAGACAPQTTITSGPSGTIGQSTATFEFTSSIDGSSFECVLDGLSPTLCASPQNFTGLADGPHELCVRAIAGVNLDPTPDCRSFTVDTTAPTVSVTCSGAPGSATRSCAWTVDDPSATVSCSVDGSAVSPCPNPIIVSGFGTHTLTFTATDLVGNSGTASITLLIPQPIVVQITAPANNSTTTASSIGVSFTVNGAPTIPAGTTCTINGSPVTSTSGNVVALVMGANTIAATCNDGTTTATSVVVVTRGNVPVVMITNPDNGQMVTAPSVNVSYVVNGGSVIPAGTTCTVNGVASTSTTTNQVAIPIGPSFLITVACTNMFGTGTHSVLVQHGDSFVIIEQPADPTNTTGSSINVRYSINGSTVIPAGTVCTVRNTSTGVQFNSTSGATNSVALAMGANIITVNCVNSFGPLPSDTVTVNRGTPPAVTITTPPNGLNTTASSINVAFVVNGSSTIPAGIGCTIQGAPTSSTTTNPVPLNFGANTIAVSCVNAFGVGSSSVVVTRTSNELVITSPQNNSFTSAPSTNVSYFLNGSATIPAGTTCTVNGAASLNGTTNLVPLNLGVNTITVACTSASGILTRSVTVTRGNPPTVAITSPNPGTPLVSPINVQYLVNGAPTIPSGTTCTVNGQVSTDPSNNPIPLTTPLNITVTCTNAFGAGSASVTISPQLPVVVITAPANGTANPPPTINVSYTVNGSTTIPAGTTCSINGQPSSSGLNNSVSLGVPPTLVVTCTNAFGSGSDSVTFISVPPPQVAITAPANNSWTAAATTNVEYTVDGATSIPAGTTCTVNGVPSTSTQVNSVNLAVGANSIVVMCTNSFGSSSPATRIVNRDVSPPTISSIWITPRTTPGPATITYTVSDNSGQPVSCTPPSGSTIQLVSGMNLITINCVDLAGNAASASSTISIPDSGSFTVSIDSGPPSQTMDNTPSFTYSSSVPIWYTPPCAPGTVCIQIAERVISFLCTMDGSSVPCGDSSYTSPALPVGPHTFCVTGRYVQTGVLSNTDCHSFTVIDETPWPPAVAITSPVTGLNTSASSVNVAYTVNGSTALAAGTTCTVNGAASSSASSNNVALAVGANTITVVCADSAGTGSAVVTVTRTAVTEFGPTFDHRLSPETIGQRSRMNFGFTTPEGTEGVRHVQISEDVKVAANFPGFGVVEDGCSSITTIPFDATSCPDSSFVGTLQLVITGVTNITYGKIYLVHGAPLPRLAVDMKVSSTGGPANMDFQTFITQDVVKVDPSCDESTDPDGFCEMRLILTMDNLPNIGITGGYVALGRSGRVGVNGPLETELYRTVLGGPTCDPTITTIAQFTGWSGSTASRTDTDTHTCP